jgi:hypothetical protein
LFLDRPDEIIGKREEYYNYIILSKTFDKNINNISNNRRFISDNIKIIKIIIIELLIKYKNKIDFLKIEIEIFINFRFKI